MNTLLKSGPWCSRPLEQDWELEKGASSLSPVLLWESESTCAYCGVRMEDQVSVTSCLEVPLKTKGAGHGMYLQQWKLGSLPRLQLFLRSSTKVYEKINCLRIYFIKFSVTRSWRHLSESFIMSIQLISVVYLNSQFNLMRLISHFIIHVLLINKLKLWALN